MAEADPDGQSMRPLSDARKEQIKLRATFLNGIGIGVMLIGVITPPIRTLYGDIDAQIHPIWLVLVPLACFALGITLHWVGSTILKGLSQ
ncbi:hypothetical protein [Rhizobium straminoryzae]|uniref:Uncharacterized protein n=1 Tax=Rhizobium straminoryzae TaxID=1387186 RepID=A0A549T311_9HYPH|nr:hypothetical protein [Rhizobium straminoryzae]TRL36269.1 hypothetical protein FNA46_18525 [Rhizobium straminoryzae]